MRRFPATGPECLCSRAMPGRIPSQRSRSLSRPVEEEAMITSRLLRLAVAGLVVAGFAFPARADHRHYVINIHDSGAATGGIFVDQGDVSEGVLLHEGTLTHVECAELVAGREGFHNFYARAVSLGGGVRWYVKIVDIREGIGSAMSGFARSQTSPDNCGAAGIVPLTPTNYINSGG